MPKLTPEECKRLVDATIRMSARVYVQYKNQKLRNSEDIYPYGLEKVKWDENSKTPDMDDLAQKIHDELVLRSSEYNSNYLEGIRAIGKFDKVYVKKVIGAADLNKALTDPERAYLKKDEETFTAILKAKVKKEAKKESPPKKENSHVGKKVYFNPKGEAILSGTVSAHGKHGVTIRDKGGNKHHVEHGKYQVHEEDETTGSFGDEDFGEELKKGVEAWLNKAEVAYYKKRGMLEAYQAKTGVRI